MEELPLRIIYTGPPGVITRRFPLEKQREKRRAREEGEDVWVKRYARLLEIASYGTAGDVITAPFAGVLQWLAPPGLVWRGRVVATLTDASIEVGSGFVTIGDWEEPIYTPAPRLPGALPTVCPYPLRGLTLPKQYKIDEADRDRWEEWANALGTNGSDLLRLAIRSILALPEGERLAWWEGWQHANQDLR